MIIACTLIDDIGLVTCEDDFGITSIDSSTATFGAYWTPNDGKTTLSATYGIISLEIPGTDIENIDSIHFGIDQEVGPGVLSAASSPKSFISSSSNGNYHLRVLVNMKYTTHLM